VRTDIFLVVFLILVPTSAVSAHLFAAWMRRVHLGQRIREYGPKLHEGKSGTPTMGGTVVIALWGGSLGALSFFHPIPWEGLFILSSGLIFGAVGLVDDLLALRRSRSLGLRPWQKVLLVSLGAGILFIIFGGIGNVPFRLPFSARSVAFPAGIAFFVYWAVFLATTNSMNLTDGLDGLAAGAAILILVGDLLIVRDRAVLATLFPLIPILIGFLWVNSHPARLFLGDVGSFALGGVVAAAAIVTGTAFILPILAGLLVLEAGSVILQVASFKLLGRRIFKISPLHHHFEHAEGIDYGFLLPNVEWPEERIVVRLWIVEGLLAALAVLATGV